MSATICKKHQLPIDSICARNQCRSAYCTECMSEHASKSKHSISVKLSEKSKNFFITWSEYIIPRVGQMIAKLRTKGYTSVFDLNLKENYPKEKYAELQPKQIDELALEVLSEHKTHIIDDLNFVSSCKKLEDLRIPEFYKGIFDLFVEDSTSNMQKIGQNLEKRLAEKFPNKKIYKFVEFKVNSHNLKTMEDTRRKLIRVIEKTVVTKLGDESSKDQGRNQVTYARSPTRVFEPVGKPSIKVDPRESIRNPESPNDNPRKTFASPQIQVHPPPKQAEKRLKTEQNQVISPKFGGRDRKEIASSLLMNSKKEEQVRKPSKSSKNLGNMFDGFDPMKKKKQESIQPIAQSQRSIGSIGSKALPKSPPTQLRSRISPIKTAYKAEDSNKTDNEMESRNSNDQLANNDSRKDAIRMQKTISSLENQISELNFSSKTSQAKNSRELKDAKFQTERQKRTFESTIRSLENNLHSKENEIIKLKRQNSDLQENLNKKSQFIIDLLNNFPAKVNYRETEQFFLKKQIQQLVARKNQLQAKFEAQSSTYRTENIESSTVSMEEQIGVIANLESSIEELQQANEKLKKNEKQLQGQIVTKDRQIRENNQQKGNLVTSTKEKDQLMTRLKEKDQIFESFKTQKEAHIKQLQNQIKDLTKALQHKATKVTQQVKPDYMEKLQETIQGLQEKLKECKDTETNERKDICSQLEAAQRDNRNLKKKVKENLAKISSLEKTIQKEANIDEQLLQDIVELDTQISAKDKDIQCLIAVLIECSRKYQIDKEYISQKLKHLVSLKIEIK